MVQGERRQQSQRDLRRRILETARALFVEAGYEAVTMRGIAERIGYSATTIYLHFRDKKALVDELCTEDFLALAHCFPTAADHPDPIARLRAIGLAFLDFGLQHPNHYRMMFMTSHPAVPAEARRIERGSLHEDAWAILVAGMAEAQATGAIPPGRGTPQELAQQCFAALHGVLSLHLAKGNDPWIQWAPVQQAGEQLLDTLLRGLTIPEGKHAAVKKPSRGRRP